ncbi:MAG: ABC transporter ATP-binding protein [Clostridiales bacterium]|nr:ABC transporter ATP-binding protein [Clostridiales bacterium]
MMTQHTLETQNIKAGYDGKVILDGVDITIPDGKITVIIGANACGKSTLLKTIARLIKPISGEIIFDGQNIHHIAPKQLARDLGLLPQSPVVPEGITVADLVARGRFPHQSFLRGMSKNDFDAVEEALESMGILELAERSVDELSGGQRQRVWIAMALAQETDVLLLDEPTTYLDVSHQIEILDLLMDLNRTKGKTIVMVLHDINLSARYADYLFALKQGKVIAEGKPSDILCSELVKKVFDLDCTVLNDPISDTPMIVPIGRHHRN